jgi:hypothetical protein
MRKQIISKSGQVRLSLDALYFLVEGRKALTYYLYPSKLEPELGAGIEDTTHTNLKDISFSDLFLYI